MAFTLPDVAPIQKPVGSPLALPVSPYGTHLMPLLAAVANTTGPVLECGTGLFSTPILHTLCAPTRRKLVSLETDGEWMERFVMLRRPWHEIRLIEDWARCLTARPEPQWAVVLVDNNPHEARQHVLAALADRALILVLHDSEQWTGGFAGWHVYQEQQAYIGSFKYRRHFDGDPGRMPRTTLLSNHVPLDVLEVAW